MIITPKNWSEFQHYKDRAPPWIKLHKGLLDNFDFQSLPVASRALAPMLWLLASEEKDGQIDAQPEKLAFRLRMSVEELKPALEALIDKGFFLIASKPLAKRKHVAVPETETEAYKPETEGETESAASTANPINSETWKAYKAAYIGRYGVAPVRNASVNAKIKAFVVRLGAESPDVAMHYVRSNAAFYVRDKHGVGPMLKDAEGLRTEWATGNSVTQTQAMQADKTAANGEVWGKLIREAEERERNAAISQPT